MGRIHLVTGGCRSGKSAQALSLAERLSESRTFLATCPVKDEEMAERVRLHRRARRDRGWQTVEEPLALEDAIRGGDKAGVVLVDCLSLWVSNMMLAEGDAIDESVVAQRCGRVLQACRSREGSVVFVSNEVGMGVVPPSELGRRYRDLLGRCNQVMADGADAVTLMVSGIQMQIKGAEE